MNVHQLSTMIADDCGIPVDTAKQVLRSLVKVVEEVVPKGGDVPLHNLGRFKLVRTKSRAATPMTGGKDIPERDHVRFVMSGTARRRLRFDVVEDGE